VSPTDKPQYVTTRELREILPQLGEAAIFAFMRRHGARIGNRYLIRREKLDEILDRGEMVQP
jgi:hypothetical protein